MILYCHDWVFEAFSSHYWLLLLALSFKLSIYICALKQRAQMSVYGKLHRFYQQLLHQSIFSNCNLNHLYMSLLKVLVSMEMINQSCKMIVFQLMINFEHSAWGHFWRMEMAKHYELVRHFYRDLVTSVFVRFMAFTLILYEFYFIYLYI